MKKSTLVLVCFLFVCTTISCRRANLEDIEEPKIGQTNSDGGQNQSSTVNADGENTGDATPANKPSGNKPATSTVEVKISYDGKAFTAAVNDYLIVLKELIESKKVKFNIIDEDGRNLMHIACLQGNFSIAQYLYELAPGLAELKDNKEEKTPLEYAEFKNVASMDGINPKLFESTKKIIQMIKGIEIKSEDFISELFQVLTSDETESGSLRINEIFAELRKFEDVKIKDLVDDREILDENGEEVEAKSLPVIFMPLGFKREYSQESDTIISGGNKTSLTYGKILIENGISKDVKIEITKGRRTIEMTPYQFVSRFRIENKEEWKELLKP